MVVAIHQPNFLPWLGYFYKLSKSHAFVLLDDAQYSKDSYINRTRIKTPTGARWLTVPVLTKGRMGQRIDQVEISQAVAWRRDHLNGLRCNYASSPHAFFTLPLLEEVYSRPWVTLSDLNTALIKRVCGLVGITTPIVLASELGCHETGTERLVAICRSVGASVYLSGSGGRKYQDEDAFRRSGISVAYSDFVHPCYPQLWGDFVKGLSVIDLLCSCGPRTAEILHGCVCT